MSNRSDNNKAEPPGGLPPNGPVVFNRKKNVDIRLTDGFITVTAHMADNYHEMAVVLDIAIPGMVITSIQGHIIRVPHESCREGLAALPGAVGLEIKKGLTLRMENAIGGPDGCTHMTNLVMEACHASIQGQYLSLREAFGDLLDEMTPAERTKWFLASRPQMLDSCVAYRGDSPIILEAKQSPSTERIACLNKRIAAVYRDGKEPKG
ncbi:MAG: DUF2889 domain-containing protein [Deltaproteobacteria bacterium]|nr:DUF2889 domain-containing protein [Candidatus Zymogenaceae bacterium]